MRGAGNRLALDAGQNVSIVDFFQQYPVKAAFALCVTNDCFRSAQCILLRNKNRNPKSPSFAKMTFRPATLPSKFSRTMFNWIDDLFNGRASSFLLRPVILVQPQLFEPRVERRGPDTQNGCCTVLA